MKCQLGDPMDAWGYTPAIGLTANDPELVVDNKGADPSLIDVVSEAFDIISQ